MHKKIPGFKLNFSESQIQSVLNGVETVLRSGMISASAYVTKIEEQSKKFLRIPFCLGVSSGTTALEMAAACVKKFDYKKRSKILVPVNTFIATALAMEKVGYSIEFVDMELEYLGMDLEQARAMIDADPDIAAVTVVHIGGYINPGLKDFAAFCKTKNVFLIEDCAHAYGSEGAGQFGDVSAFSFFATKVFTAGEGGLITTHYQQFNDYMVLLRNFGKTDPWQSYHIERGYNYRMSEFAAIVLNCQLEIYDEVLNNRQRIFDVYKSNLKDTVGLISPGHRCSWYKITILSDKKEEIKKVLNENNIHLAGGIYDIPLNKMPVYIDNISKQFPVAERFAGEHICLPVYSELQDTDIIGVCNIINTFY